MSKSKTNGQGLTKNRVLNLLKLGLIGLLLAVPLLMRSQGTVEGAASTQLNFQARLLGSSGAIVPDGNYHVEFKLYNASSGGSALWTETRTGGNRVSVKSGYLSVYLGSVTSFPTTINWNEEHWITMNIGGSTGTASWDGEMNPRIKLTAVPFAFQAEQLAKTSGANRGTLGFNTVANNPNITLPDATGTVCLQTSSSCGFATGSGAAFLVGGNTVGGATSLGLQSNQDLNVITNNLTRMTIQADGDAAFDTNTLFVDAANNRVGVGTATPNATLEVAGDTDISGHLAFGDFANVTSTNALTVGEIYLSGDDCSSGCFGMKVGVISSNAGGTNETLTAVSGGVATTAASFTLDNAIALRAENAVKGAGSTITNNYGLYVENLTSGTNDYGLYVAGADTYAIWVDAGATRLDGTFEVQGNSTLGDAAGDTLTLNGTNISIPNNLNFDSDTLFLNASNNRVGIGTNTPGYTLDVNGSISIAPNTTSILFGTADGSKIYGLGPRSGSGDNQFSLTYEGNTVLTIGNDGRVGIGVDAEPGARLEVAGNKSGNAWGFNGQQLRVDSASFNDENTAASGTATNAVLNSFAQSTITASNSSVTITNAATLYIADAPTAGTNITQITNPYAFWVDAGATRLDGTLQVGTLGATNTDAILCRNSSGQLAACSSTFLTSSTAFVQGGNDFGGNAILGTNGAGQSLIFETANTTRLTIDTSGNATLTGDLTVQGTGNSSFAGNLQVNGNATIGDNTSDTLTINSTAVSIPNNLNFDSNTLFINASTNRVGIGNNAPGAALEVTGDIYLTKESARTIKVVDSTTASTVGADLSILGAAGNSATGGAISITSGSATGSGNAGGGGINITAGAGIGLSTGGAIDIHAGGSLSGGQIRLNGGDGFGAQGDVLLQTEDTNSAVGIGVADADAHLELGGNMALNAWGFNGPQFQSSSATYTDVNTAASGTATNAVINSFGRPTLAATNTNVTVTNAATVYIQNSPLAGSNMSITNAYALWVDDGVTRLDHSSTSTTAGTERGTQVTMTDTGVVTTGTDTTYGQQISVTRTGATGGTINTFGLDIQATGDAGGTSTLTGLNVNVSGADTNYAAIFQGGNVGIGDTTPVATLTVGSGDLFQVAGASGNVTTAGTVTVNGGTITSNSVALAVTGGTTLSLQSTGANAVSLDSGTTGGINIGTSTGNAKTIQIGTTSTNTGVTQTIGIGNLNAAGTTNITIGTGTSATAGTTTVQAKGVLTLTGTGGITATGAAASSLTTSAGALTLTGAAASTWSTSAGALTLTSAATAVWSVGGTNQDLTLQTSGTGTVAIQAAGAGTVAIGNNNQNSTVNIGHTGSTANTTTVNIATTSGNSTQAVNIGSSGNTSNTIVLESGTGAAAIQIGNGATVHGIQIGTGAAAQTITIGSTNTTSSTTIQAGTGGVSLLGSVVARATTDAANVFQLQNSVGATLLSLDSSNTGSSLNLMPNSGGETAAGFTTTYPAAGFGTNTAVSQTTTSGEYASGTAGIKAIITPAAVTSGVRANLGAALSTGSIHVITFSAKTTGSDWTGDIDVRYNRTGTTSDGAAATCSTSNNGNSSFNTRLVKAAEWTKITCYITTSGSAGDATANIVIFQTASATRTFYIDNISVVKQTTTTQNTGVLKVGGSTSQGLTLFTLDTYAATPFTGSISALAGSMYFDTTQSKIQCYDGTTWGACGAAPNGIVTLTPEYAGATLNGTGIGTLTSDFCSSSAGVLTVGTLCANGEARNFYKWTSPQGTLQTYSIFVTYKLPSTFKAFVDANTIKLTWLTDSASGTNGKATYQVFRKASAGGVTSCDGTNESTVTTPTANAWNTTSFGGDETACGFVGGDYVIFKINVKSMNNANIYVENLDFSYTNQ